SCIVFSLTGQAKALHRAVHAFVEYRVQVWRRGGYDQQAGTRYRLHQMVELQLDILQVAKNIGMVELEIAEDRGAWQVMDELLAIVEEGTVIFIGLDHEKRRIAEPRRHRKILWHATNQVTRRKARLVENPGKHAR